MNSSRLAYDFFIPFRLVYNVELSLPYLLAFVVDRRKESS